MFQFEASGGVTPTGEPVVQLIAAITVPLKDADAIAAYIKRAGTHAVLAAGAFRNGEPTVFIGGPAPSPEHDEHCKTCSDGTAEIEAFKVENPDISLDIVT